ncbi:MAG TPA: pilus assembly protein TadG-related protein [Candidatus Sulfotelmatobacter sp.]|nr:pilus assembly protein TadG-related protein [Candidatus Sulfotelmatobacter sp.]
MKKPFVSKSREHRKDYGVTMILVALAMVAIIGMAVLSIDVVTLYLAKEEAQRSADAAALAGARVLSLSGITGDPTNSSFNWGAICGGTSGVATLTAQAVAAQNIVGNQAAPTVTVTYSAGTNGTVGTGTSDCTSLSSSAFGVNPMVTVKVTQAGLPNFFSRLWSRSGNSVSATATAEAFNPSDSGNSGNQVSGTITPVRPRCVKPWVVPNLDPLNPLNPPGCGTNCLPFVSSTTGQIQHQGISLNGTGTGVIGETFWLVADCNHGDPNKCTPLGPPQANYPAGSIYTQGPPNLLSLPGQITTPVTAIPSCSGGDPYEEAIEGCDAPDNYQCGVPLANSVDLTKHNPGVNSITNAVQCLIHQTDSTNITGSSGQDYLKTSGTFGAPSAYPFQILAGSSNPLGLSGTPITSSNSIVSLPIYDQIAVPNPPGNATTPVTFIGFLQVFINAVDGSGNRLVTVLNVAGCGNGTNTTSTSPVQGSSPVPVRLITAP